MPGGVAWVRPIRTVSYADFSKQKRPFPNPSYGLRMALSVNTYPARS